MACKEKDWEPPTGIQIISWEPPSAAEIAQNEKFEEALRCVPGVYEPEEVYNRREATIRELDDIVMSWLLDLYQTKLKKTEQEARACGGGLFLFGSMRLGVHGDDADIDGVLVCNREIDRNDHFFGSLVEYLRQYPTSITTVQPITDAFVPVIKLEIRSFQADLSFARLAPEGVDCSDFRPLDDIHLKHVDEQTQRSLNGIRVADKTLQSVPNVATFRSCLRAVRIWAKNKGIYGNAFGYPGGVAWALMVGRTHQMFPQANASTLFQKFFKVFRSWKFPNPVFIQSVVDLGMGFKCYDNTDTAHDTCPVITPCYPTMNSTHNVGKASLERMTQEWLYASQLFETKPPQEVWPELFRPADFFLQYPKYIRVTIDASTPEEFQKWQSWVEVKLRLFQQKIQEKIAPTTKVFLWPKFIPDEGQTKDKYSSGCYYIGVSRDKASSGETMKFDITTPTTTWVSIVKDYRMFNRYTMNGPYITLTDAADLPKRLFTARQRQRLKQGNTPAASVSVDKRRLSAGATKQGEPANAKKQKLE